MIRQKLKEHSWWLFTLVLILILIAVIVCGCNKIIVPQPGQSVQILQDINGVKAMVLIDKEQKDYEVGRVNIKAGAMFVYLTADEYIDASAKEIIDAE